MPLRGNPALCLYWGHLPSKHLNHRPPSVTVPWTASARADWLAHHPAPMVERSICLSVRQAGDDAVIADIAPLFAFGGVWLLRNPVAESFENLFLTAKNSPKSLTSHVGPQPKSDEASASEFRVVGRGKCTVWHSHFDVPSFEIPRMCTWAPVRRKHEGSGHPMSNQSSAEAGSAMNSFRLSSRSSYFQVEQG